jgi:hypothetical protein
VENYQKNILDHLVFWEMSTNIHKKNIHKDKCVKYAQGSDGEFWKDKLSFKDL